jgi:hypothetical protein
MQFRISTEDETPALTYGAGLEARSGRDDERGLVDA